MYVGMYVQCNAFSTFYRSIFVEGLTRSIRALASPMHVNARLPPLARLGLERVAFWKALIINVSACAMC